MTRGRFVHFALAALLLGAAVALAPLTGSPATSTASLGVSAAYCSLESTGGLVQRDTDPGWNYHLYVPTSLADLPPGTPVPLLVAFHGLTQSGSSFAPSTGWMPYSEQKHFIVAFPSSPTRSWFNTTPTSAEPHVNFARDVVEDIRGTYCIDSARIFSTGYSHGAYFSQRLACDASDLFASFTEYAGGAPGSTCDNPRGVSIGMFHGDNDAVVSVDSGRSSRDAWVERLHCAPEPAREDLADGFVLVYTGCDDGGEVMWREYPGQSHSYPSGARGDDIRDRMWNFHMRAPMPGATSPDQPPTTTVTSGPAPVEHHTQATFTFTGDDDRTPASLLSFECSLDHAAFLPCTSPATYGGLALGDHSFAVRAVDEAGNRDPAPAVHTWRIEYRFDGFRDPTVNPPGINTAKAGSTHTLRWQLHLDDGPVGDTASTGHPAYSQANCDDFTLTTATTPAAGPGARPVKYDDDDEQFSFAWATPAAAGCYRFELPLADGTTKVAYFNLH